MRDQLRARWRYTQRWRIPDRYYRRPNYKPSILKDRDSNIAYSR
jgi:hypothetical protein